MSLKIKLLKDKCFINNQWVDSSNGQSFIVSNPATGKKIGSVPDVSVDDIFTSIDGAFNAQKLWSARSAEFRCGVLHSWFELIQDHSHELAKIITAECGKPIAESIGEVSYGASFVQWFSEEGKRTYGDVIPSPSTNKRMHTIKQPVGVCVAITPWNFPLAMITRKVAPALAAGCSIIIKPSELSPLTALALAKLGEVAGFPAGILQVVTASTGKDVGKVFTSDKRVKKVTFTGSTAVGKTLIRQCANTVKRISMELGGNAPFIIFDDANIDAAVTGLMAAKYRNSGQTCVCVNRILVQKGIKKAFLEKLVVAVQKLKVGNGADPTNQIGPLINDSAVLKVENHIADALAKGARLVIGGSRHSLGGGFFQPTIIDDVTPEMVVANEETFGPLCAIFEFTADEDAIVMANSTDYGLAAYVFTESIKRSVLVTEALEFGMVGINEGLISTAVAPFGGVKESGMGREGSKYGIDEYMNIKYVCTGGL